MKKLSLTLLLPALALAMDSGMSSVGNTPRINLDQLQRTSSLETIDLEKSTGRSGFHGLLHEYAPEGTRCRKYAERRLENGQGSLPRTLSSQDLSAEEVVSALVKASNDLDKRGDKHKTRKNQYKIIAALGTGCGACLASLITGVITALWTHFHTKADC